MSINKNVEINEICRKNKGCIYNISQMSATSYSRLPNLERNQSLHVVLLPKWYDMQMIYFAYSWMFMKTWEIREKC